MAEPGDSPGLAEVVRGWAERLTHTGGVDLSSDQVEELLSEFAAAAVATVEQAREAAVRRFSALYSASPIGIALADPDGEIVEANAAMAGFLGRRAEELHGLELADLGFGDHDTEDLKAGLEDLAETDAEYNRQRVQLAHSDAAAVWADVTLAYLPGDKPSSVFPVLMAVDANDLHALQETLRHQSVHDALTGLPNAARFMTKLEAALGPTARDQIALVYLDLDGFRVINDGLDVGAGDEVLYRVARKLQNAFTSHHALVARMSGDGFAVLLRGRLTSGEVIAMVERAMEELGEPVYVDGKGVGVSASAGVVVRDVGEGGAEDIRRAAELALHRAKEAGRAQWMLFDPELDTRDRSRYRLGAEIAGALENGEFDVVYLPTILLGKPGELAAVSAGLLWHHPDLGELYSDRFLPLAETIGMTTLLGRWLIAESLAAAARWRERHGDDAPDTCIRLPRRLAIDPDLVKLVREQLDKHNVPASALRLCVDAATIVDRNGDVLESLTVLAELGAKIVLIVSGSADMELIPAHDLPVQHILLNGQVVDAFAEGEPTAAVRHLKHLVRRAREVNLRIGAEGVRSHEHAARLRRHGVIAANGPFLDSATGDEIDELVGRYAS